MDTINDILRSIIEVNKKKSLNKHAMMVLIEQEAKFSQEEAVLLKKLMDYHKFNSDSKQDILLQDDPDSKPDVVDYVKDITKTSISDTVSETSTEELSDDDDDDNDDDDDDDNVLTEDILMKKSVEELKEIYVTFYGKKPRGKSASKPEWLISKILEESKKRTYPNKSNSIGSDVVKKSSKKQQQQQQSPPPPPPPPQDSDLNNIDEDLDQIVYKGKEYDVTKISSDETWLLNDGKQVGKIKTVMGEGVFEDTDNKKVIMLECIFEGVKYYLVDDESDKINKLVFNDNEEYVGLYNISKESITFRDKQFTRYHHTHRN
uniref:Uncharacterized protein n=1 Tax=viral metagenome TaxID=1070528 RepID=A0A6C0CYE7_9ZZZZ